MTAPTPTSSTRGSRQGRWVILACLILASAALAACVADAPSADPTAAPPPPSLSSPTDGVAVAAERLADGLTAPIGLVSPPGEPRRRLVLDQVGEVRELTDRGLSKRRFLDVRDDTVPLWQDRDDERGLLGMVFSPTYRRDRQVYVFRTAPSDRDDVSHVNTLSRFQVSADGTAVDPSSEKVLWSRPQQEPSHAAGQLAFDTRGRLLLFLGDGQAVGVQDRALPIGKVLRVDLRRPRSAPTIVASGLRHPWRISYDPPTRQWLMAEPNYTSRFQEVNAFAEGANYGWQIDEVPAACWGLTGTTPAPGCLTGPDREPLTPPVAEYGPDLGLIISGAHIYRANGVPALRDRLVAADWGITSSGDLREGRLLVSDPVTEPPYRLTQAELTGVEDRVWFWSLARDAAGELYLMTLDSKAPQPGGGTIYRLIPAR